MVMQQQSELPKGWVWTTIEEICLSPQYGWTTSATSEGKLKLLRTTDISSGKIEWESVPFCEKEPQNIDKYLLTDGDIVISRAGSVGYSYLIKNPETSVFASYLIRFKPLINEQFVAFFLKSPSYWDSISEKSLGIAVPNINASKLKQIEIPLPPLQEQHRIVSAIETLFARLDAANERLDRVPEILKKFRQSVLAAACDGGLTEGWREENQNIEYPEDFFNQISEKHHNKYIAACETAKRKGERAPKKPKNIEPTFLENKDFIDVPEKWIWMLLPDIGYINRGTSRNRPRNDPSLFGGKYPFIQTGEIARSNGRITTHKKTYNENGLAQSKLWPKGTVCITIAANIANSGILAYPACFPDSVVGVIPDDEICNNEYLEYFVRTAKDNLSQFAPATAQKNINIAILNDVAIPLPPLPEQYEIVRRVDALFALADSIEAKVAAARERTEKLRQSILAKAFFGELVETEAELARREGRDYEPADVLLERIKAEQGKSGKKGKAAKGKSSHGR